MRLSALDRKLFRDLWRLRAQVFAIACVIGAGIALLVATFGCMVSLELSQDAFYERYRFAQVFATLKRAPNPLAERLAAVPGAARVETRVVADVILDVPGMDDPATGRLISYPDIGAPLLNDLALQAGRMLEPERPSEVLVTEAFAQAQGLKPGDALAAVINGHRRRLEIVGVVLTPEYIYSLAPGQVMPDEKRFGVLWMSRKALAAAFDLQDAFNSVAVSLARGAVAADVIARIDDILRPYGGTGAYERKDQISHFFLSNELKQLRTTGTFVPPIFLAVAAFLLNVVVMRLVTTEREQIGLLKAFGYTDVEVGLHYLKLVLAIVVLGFALGLGAGFALGDKMTGLYAAYFKFPILSYRVDGAVIVAAAAVALAAGTAGGLGAIRQSVRLAPAAAMAPPVPTTFRRTRLGAWLGGLRFSQPTRMIFRHVTRWPVRTGFTVTGIAFSVALMIASLFFVDSVEQVIDVYFFQAQRQSLTVAFVEPRSAAVEQEIRRLPGVIATQPARTVSVILRHGLHSKRTAIQAVVPDADLNRLLDAERRPVIPPEAGLALSAHLAAELGVGVGDTVTAEVMQERRPVADLPVTMIVEEYLGFSAYMSAPALHRLMREGDVVSGIHVMTDGRGREALFRKLKATPAVAIVAQTDAALASFRATMDQTMYVMIGFYVAFASVIAFGVAYNSARIALSERARDLASLRVLGFTGGEVAYILLGELGIQGLVALPFGCVLGTGLAHALAPMLKTDMYDFPMVITRATYGAAMAVAVVAGIVCAGLVWRRADRLDLVAVLKTRE